MILKIFAIYDQKAEAYLQPFFLPTTGMAVRSFIEASNDPNCQFSKNPEDFFLYEVGEYDDAHAALTQGKLISLGSALEHRTQAKHFIPGTKEHKLAQDYGKAQ